MRIRRLDPTLVNQIAAGEVVERPSSVVKELLENAFDAGASRIEIEIRGGGRDLIRVADDGRGIDPEDLPLAIASHATSKVARIEDLEAIGTMGFRGEALASIASVATFRLESRTGDHDEAWAIDVVGGVAEAPAPCSGPVGTRVEVAHLFRDLPARRRFLKSDGAEAGRVAEVVRNLALTRPQIAFQLTSGGRTLLEYPASDDPRRRILEVLGRELDGHLLEIQGEIGDPADGTFASVWGMIGTPETARPTSKAQRFVLNGRVIVDRSLAHALKEGFRGFLEPSKHPVAVVHLDVAPSRVDVNVHPAKTEVRFREPRPLHGLVRRAVQAALESADLVRDLSLPPAVDQSPEPTRSTRGGDSVASTAASSGRSVVSSRTGANPDPAAWRAAMGDAPWPEDVPLRDTEPPLPMVVGRDAVLQIHDAFLVTQDAEGLVIIDQHALHERVMFETLQTRLAVGPLESQRQLVPVVFDAEPSSIAGLETLAPLLVRLGIDATASGPRGVAIHAFPTLLLDRKVDPGPFLSELLERHAAGEIEGPETEAALSEVLDMMSCKAAVKAGDRLRPQEIAALLAMRDSIDRGASCPHGRPTHLRIPIQELERRFGRSSG